VGSPEDRITPAVDLRTVARQSEKELTAPTSGDRPSVPASSVPVLLVTVDELRDLPLDPRTAYLVSLIDGTTSVEEIADIAGDAEEVNALFARLLKLAAIDLRSPR
jgi:hypothetical protein